MTPRPENRAEEELVLLAQTRSAREARILVGQIDDVVVLRDTLVYFALLAHDLSERLDELEEER